MVESEESEESDESEEEEESEESEEPEESEESEEEEVSKLPSSNSRERTSQEMFLEESVELLLLLLLLLLVLSPGGLTDVAKKVEEDLLRVDLSKASSTGVSSTSSNGAFVAAVELAIGIHVDTVVIQTGEDLGEVQAMVVTMMVVAMMVTVMVMMMRGRSINHI